MNKPILVLGGGGHAAVLVDILKCQNKTILGLVSPEKPEHLVFKDIPHFVKDEDVLSHDVKDIVLVNGIGSLPNNSLRFKLYELFKGKGYSFLTVVADSAYVSSYATLDEGVQVMPGAIIQTGAVIGNNSIINSGAVVDHDCKIGNNNHIATRACLSGHVNTGAQVHVGTGASVIQSINIGNNCVIGAGASINRNILNNTIVYPAKNFVKRVGNE